LRHPIGRTAERCPGENCAARSGPASASRCWWRPRNLVSTLPLALALCRFGALTGRRTVRPVEETITGDGPMIACEVAWLGLFCAGLAAAG
jgi:hypothetical protein